MTKLVYKITERLNQKRIDEILRIESEKGLTAERLLEAASKKTNPLHDLFEWNDSLAAHNYRLQQARVFINEVKVIIENKEYYAFENVKVSVFGRENNSENLHKTERVYKPVMEILSNEELRQQIINSALKHHEYWEAQNEKYSELSPIIKAAKKVRQSLQNKWQKKNKQ